MPGGVALVNDAAGGPPKRVRARLLLLGNYVDRGMNGLYLLGLLLCDFYVKQDPPGGISLLQRHTQTARPNIRPMPLPPPRPQIPAHKSPRNQTKLWDRNHFPTNSNSKKSNFVTISP